VPGHGSFASGTYQPRLNDTTTLQCQKTVQLSYVEFCGVAPCAPGQAKITCESDGLFHPAPQDFTCKNRVETCYTQTDLHGTWTPAPAGGFTIGTRTSLSCSSPYIKSGAPFTSDRLICYATGWSLPPEHCYLPVACPSIYDPHGTWSAPPSGSLYTPGTNATLRCTAGYHPISTAGEESTVTCGVDRQWMSLQSKCGSSNTANHISINWKACFRYGVVLGLHHCRANTTNTLIGLSLAVVLTVGVGWSGLVREILEVLAVPLGYRRELCRQTGLVRNVLCSLLVCSAIPMVICGLKAIGVFPVVLVIQGYAMRYGGQRCQRRRRVGIDHALQVVTTTNAVSVDEGPVVLARSLHDSAIMATASEEANTIDTTAATPSGSQEETDCVVLQKFLEDQGMLQHLQKLHDNEVTFDTLLLFSENDMKECGIAKGPRVKILHTRDSWWNEYRLRN
jgi:hypothetical protein